MAFLQVNNRTVTLTNIYTSKKDSAKFLPVQHCVCKTNQYSSRNINSYRPFVRKPNVIKMTINGNLSQFYSNKIIKLRRLRKLKDNSFNQ